MCGVALAGCGSKDEKKQEAPVAEEKGTGTGTGTAAPATPAGGVLAAAPGASGALASVKPGELGLGDAPSAPPNADCQAACDHRASCGLGDAARCAAECSALVEAGTLTAADLGTYAKAACDAVKETEPQFRLATACRDACAHRATCIAGADVKECIPDCATLVIALRADPADALGDYMRMSCDQVKQQEPTMACLAACEHVLSCGVAGDLPTCLKYCGEQLGKGVTVQQIEDVEKASCDEVKKSVQLPQPGAAAGGLLCTAEGIYTVCDGTYCRDHVATMMGSGKNTDEAKLDAVTTCTNHMLSAVAIQSLNNRAGVKQSCQVTTCR